METTNNRKDENDIILVERAKELLNEDPKKTDDLISELKQLVKG